MSTSRKTPNKIDVKIMATIRRTEYLAGMLKSLEMDKSIIVFDDRKELGDAMYNARRSWTAPYTVPNATHRLVLQDDVEMVDGFLDILNTAVTHHPDVIWTLFTSRMKPEDYADPSTPYVRVRGRGIWGVAVVVPVKYIDPIFEHLDTRFVKNYPHDDTAFGHYASENDIDVFTTVPSLVQHLAPNNSLLKYNNKNKISKVYMGRDVSSVRWDIDTFSDSKRTFPNIIKREDLI